MPIASLFLTRPEKAITYYLTTPLLLSFLKSKAILGVFLQQILRLLQLNLFEGRNLTELFKPSSMQHVDNKEFFLFQNL